LNNSSIFKSGIFIICLIVAGKILALLKDIVISAYFGASIEVDAYFMATNTNGILFTAFWSTILIVFLPLYGEALVQKKPAAANEYASSILNMFMLISLLLTIAVYILSPQILDIVDLSLEVERRNIAVICLRIMALSFVFSTITSFMTSIQLSHNQYFYIHLIPIFNNMLVVLTAIFVSQYWGIYSVVVAGVIAWVIQVPAHFLAVKKHFKYSPKLSLNSEEWSRLKILIIPAFLGVLVDQVNIFISTVLVSNLDIGSIAALNYANKLVTLASGTFIVAIMTILFPQFSKQAAENDLSKMNESIAAGVRIIFLLMVPITIVTLFYHQQIVAVVFQRGAFDASATSLTSPILFYFSLGLIFLGLREVFNKAFYALKITTIPLYISLFCVAINIPLSIYLCIVMEAKGLAFATSITLLIYVLIQVVLLQRKIGKAFYRSIPNLLIKLLLISLMMGATLFIFNHFKTITNPFLVIMLGFTVAFSVYLLGLKLLKVEEMDMIGDVMLNWTSKRRIK